MIPITISNKHYRIKSIAELTTAEFIELSEIEDCDMIKYIAWQTKLPLNDAFFAVTSKTIEKAIGTMPDIANLKRSKKFDYTKLIDTVGQRHQIETYTKTGFSLLVYCLAVSQARSNNSDQVSDLESKYLQMPFTEILPAGFFFFRKYSTGKKRGLNFLSWLQHLINMLKKKKERVLRD